MANKWGGTVSKLEFSERWMRDGLRAVESVGGICSLLIDMSACASIMGRLKAEGTPVTYAPVIVCAAAKALARHPKLQKLIAGNKKISGGSIDVGVSIGSDEILTPVVVITNADRKTGPEIAMELQAEAATARSAAERMMKRLDRWGWTIPFSFLRKRLIRVLLAQLWYRRKLTGMIQVTIVPGLDSVAAQLFNTAAALAVGGVAERPTVVNGELRIRLTAPFTCSIDHKQWNGMNAAVFLTELRRIFEQEAHSLFS